MIALLLWGDGATEADRTKAKNIIQTELLVDLRNAILQLARHFQSLEPRSCRYTLVADYTLESHARDLENYVQVTFWARFVDDPLFSFI